MCIFILHRSCFSQAFKKLLRYSPPSACSWRTSLLQMCQVLPGQASSSRMAGTAKQKVEHTGICSWELQRHDKGVGQASKVAQKVALGQISVLYFLWHGLCFTLLPLLDRECISLRANTSVILVRGFSDRSLISERSRSLANKSLLAAYWVSGLRSFAVYLFYFCLGSNLSSSNLSIPVASILFKICYNREEVQTLEPGLPLGCLDSPEALPCTICRPDWCSVAGLRKAPPNLHHSASELGRPVRAVMSPPPVTPASVVQ